MHIGNIKLHDIPEKYPFTVEIHNDNLPLGMLHYNVPFKTIAGRSDGVF